MPHIILLGTLDSKLEQFLYLHNQLTSSPLQTRSPVTVTLIDCGRTTVSHDKTTISQTDLCRKYGSNDDPLALMNMPRGEVIRFMTACATSCVKELVAQGGVHGILSAGGSGGTSLVSAVMREAAPIGMPKLIVSTVASGDTGPLVGETDISLMYSVVDIAGSNALLRNILDNAAGAMVGMANAYENILSSPVSREIKQKTRIGVSMFGVTTPCVDKVREHLEKHYPVEVYVFHATGHGGLACERLIEEGRLDAMLDVSTTEICDFLMGGNMSAGPSRLEAALKAGIPNIISLGATDMVNFGPKSMVPVKYHDRKFVEHNPVVTLMRTTKEECREIGEFIVRKIISFAKDPSKVQVWIPKGGVSMLATPGGVFEDRLADMELASIVKHGLEKSGVKVVERDTDINDSSFAIEMADQLMQILQ